MALQDQAMRESPLTSRREYAPVVGPENNMNLPIRFIRGMTDHFRLRATGWIMSICSTFYGVVLIENPHAFEITSRPYQYLYLLRLAPERFWAYALIVIGMFRLVALVVNGTFPTFSLSPHIRAAGSFLTVFVWFQVLLGSFHEVPLNLATPAYLTFFLLDVFNVYIATLEIDRGSAGEKDKV